MDILSTINQKEFFIIFKYSPYCPISKWQEYAFDQWISNQKVEFIKINVITERDASNFVAEKFNIKHESPQIILFNNGKPIYHASHNNIDLNKIESLI